MKAHVEKLIEMAAKCSANGPALDAVHLSQAALNAANALSVLAHIPAVTSASAPKRA